MISQTQKVPGDDAQGQTITLSSGQPNVTPLQRETAELMKVLAMGETGTNYKNALITSLLVLKALAAWLFQVALTGVAVVIWLCGIGYQGGYLFRKWIAVKEPTTSDLVCTVLKVAATPFVFLYDFATGLVNQRLGWDVEFDCLEVEYDFALESLKDMDSLPKEGNRLVSVAKVDEAYHVRIFNGAGIMIFGDEQSELLPDEGLAQELNTKLIRQAIGEEMGSKTKRELIQKVKECLVSNYSVGKTTAQNPIFKSPRQQPDADATR